jgi:hypothetical protein
MDERSAARIGPFSSRTSVRSTTRFEARRTRQKGGSVRVKFPT